MSHTQEMHATTGVLPQKELNNTFIIMQCIGIVSVVFGHADIGGAGIPNIINVAFPYYAWHMPFFIFISGYFFDREMPCQKYIFKKIRTLLIPAMVANAICGVFSMCIRRFDLGVYGRNITLKSLFITPFTTGYQFYVNVSLWFVFTLFLIEIVACLIDRFQYGKFDLFILILTFAVSLYCCHCAYYNYDGTREEYFNAVLRFGFLMFFFWLGAYYRKYLEMKLRHWLTMKTAMLIFMGQAFVNGLLGYNITYNTRDMNLNTISVPGGFWVPIIVPVIAIVFFLSFSYAVAPYFEGNRVLTMLGKNTRYVVYYHQFFFVFFSFLLAVLITLKLLPPIAGFSMEQLYSSQYYVGGNRYIGFVNAIFAMTVPIIICVRLKEIKNRWISVGISAIIILLLVIFLYVAGQIL